MRNEYVCVCYIQVHVCMYHMYMSCGVCHVYIQYNFEVRVARSPRREELVTTLATS